jgi:hypothetical protein
MTVTVYHGDEHESDNGREQAIRGQFTVLGVRSKPSERNIVKYKVNWLRGCKEPKCGIYKANNNFFCPRHGFVPSNSKPIARQERKT